MLVDTIGDTVGARYSGMPSRLYLLDHRGRVAYKSGRGPFGFKPAELEHSLVLLLQDEFPELKAKDSAAAAAAAPKDKDKAGHAAGAAQDGADRPAAVTRPWNLYEDRRHGRHGRGRGSASRQGPGAPAGPGDGHGDGRGRGHRRGDLPDPGRDGGVAGLAGLADRRLADHGRQRHRRGPDLRRPGGAVSGGRRALRLPPRGLRPAGGLPLRLALDAGDRPGADGLPGSRAGDLCRAPRAALRLGAQGRGGRGDRRAGRR